MKHVLPTVLEKVADEVPPGIPYIVQINCIGSFPMNNRPISFRLFLETVR